MRLFIAASFPDAVLRDLNDRVTKLKTRLPPASWVRPETQHLTFAFLGEQPESLIARLSTTLAASLESTPRFEAHLHGCGFFPNPRHARVGWVGLEPEEKFGAVAHAVREAATTSGVALDGADFKAHLTLMRMREGWPPASIELFTKTLHDYASAPFAVECVTLYSSQLSPQGAIHTALRAFPLAGA